MPIDTLSIPLIEGFRTLFAPFCFFAKREKKSMASGIEMGCACFAVALICMILEIRKDSAHKNGQIDQICAVNCGVQQN